MNPKRSRPGGFSLIELLLVIAILGAMATAGAVALSGSVKSLQGATAAASSIFGLARTEAILRRAPVRLIIDTAYNPSKPENFLRRMTIVAPTITNGTTNWDRQISKWTTLPANAFFNSDMSKVHGQISISGLPGTQGEGSYAYYEFNPNGQAPARAQFVISSGSLNGSAFQERDPNSRYGFFIHKMGKQTFFADATSIPSP